MEPINITINNHTASEFNVERTNSGDITVTVENGKYTKTYLSPKEVEMVLALRYEEEMIKQEDSIVRDEKGNVMGHITNNISSTEQAVRDIQRLREYCENNGIRFSGSPVETIIKCVEHRLNIINQSRIEIDDFRRNRFDLNFYQDAAAKTAIYPGKGTALGLIYCALKLSGEAGEVADNVGKALRDDDIVTQIRERDNQYLTTYFNDMLDSRADKIKLELGDVLWYVSQAAKELGFTLEEIAQANLDKLAARKDKGTLKGSGDDR